MFEYFRRRVNAQSAGFRGLAALLALSIGLQICTPVFASVSHDFPVEEFAPSMGNQSPDSKTLDSSDEDSGCCLIAARRLDQGQIVSVAISAEPRYGEPAPPLSVVLAAMLPVDDRGIEPRVASASENAGPPVYLSTLRLRI